LDFPPTIPTVMCRRFKSYRLRLFILAAEGHGDPGGALPGKSYPMLSARQVLRNPPTNFSENDC
jgi:hypothetical protein